ncbi:MAG TPA: hypothetical protein VN625_10425 [Desulfuromonadaceae bacterium]|nr:hypothetical protein [Desulfuromonadaceae bacterium]
MLPTIFCGKFTGVAEPGKAYDSLRFNRFDIERLMLVLAVSLSVHLIAYGGYEIGKSRHWSWLPQFAKKQPPVPAPAPEPPVEFAMVEQPSITPPERAKYYGPQNSRAADNTHGNEDQAKINGTQTEIIKTEDQSRQSAEQLQPTPPAPEQTHVVVDPGELTMARNNQAPPPARPQKLSQVKPKTAPGLKMMQNGSAARVALAPSLDVKATPYGQYDQKFIEAVQQRWYDLLDSQMFALDRTGKVVLRFQLHYDGTISDMTVVENSVGELLGHVCENAVHDPAPFEKWTDDMRHTFGLSREITFTFYYY